MSNESLPDRVARLEALVIELSAVNSELHEMVLSTQDMCHCMVTAFGSPSDLLEAHLQQMKASVGPLLFSPLTDAGIENFKRRKAADYALMTDLIAEGNRMRALAVAREHRDELPDRNAP